jgi:hypothetical protein
MKRVRSPQLHLTLALLYVLLGVFSAWHAPHFTSRDAELHSARTVASVDAAASDDCALCAWQSRSQEKAASSSNAAFFARLSGVLVAGATLPAGEPLRVLHARGPPVILS